MNLKKNKVRVAVTIVVDDNIQFEKKISETCDLYTVLEKHINIAPVVTGVQANGQAQMIAIHCCYMVVLMTEEEKQSYEVRQTLTLQK